MGFGVLRDRRSLPRLSEFSRTKMLAAIKIVCEPSLMFALYSPEHSCQPNGSSNRLLDHDIPAC